MMKVFVLFCLEFSRKDSLKLAPNYYNGLKFNIVYKIA